jgi:hypothetical protein
LLGRFDDARTCLDRPVVTLVTYTEAIEINVPMDDDPVRRAGE